MEKSLRRIAVCFAVIVPAVVALACSNSDKPASAQGDAGGGSDGTPKPLCDLGPACQKISMACMPKDDGTPGDIHNCHMAGMVTAIESACEAQLGHCVAMCNAAPGFGDAGMNMDMSMCSDGGGMSMPDGGMDMGAGGSGMNMGTGGSMNMGTGGSMNMGTGGSMSTDGGHMDGGHKDSGS